MPRTAGASFPIGFSGMAGVYHPAPGNRAVLVCGPVGYEAFCARAFLRQLGESFAASGVACLRYDLPGQGGSLDLAEGASVLEAWRNSVAPALDALRARGATQITLLGFGLGARFVLDAAKSQGDIAALALLAPVLKGKPYLRELKAWGALVASANSLTVAAEDAGPDGLNVVGYTLDAATCRHIGALSDSFDDLPAVPTLVVARDGRAADESLVAALGARGQALAFTGYSELMTDPTGARVPGELIADISGWIVSTMDHIELATESARNEVAVLHGRGFREDLVRFGPETGLHGAFCQPFRAMAGAPVIVLVGGGRNHHEGWARGYTTMARDLARAGIASLRFDSANTGDSAPLSSTPGEILYSDAITRDVGHALDWLAARGNTRVILAGLCSGGFAAFHAGAGDPRVAGIVLINVQRLFWDPKESVADALRYGLGSAGSYAAALKRGGILRRILSGDINIKRASIKAMRRIMTMAREKTAPLAMGLTFESRVYRQAQRMFGETLARDASVLFAISEGDSAIDVCRNIFGRDLGGLKDFPNVVIAPIAGADHNLTPRTSRDVLVEILAELATAKCEVAVRDAA